MAQSFTDMVSFDKEYQPPNNLHNEQTISQRTEQAARVHPPVARTAYRAIAAQTVR